MKEILLLTVLFITMVSCANRDSIEDSSSNNIVASYRSNDTLFLENIIDSSKVIQLEVTNESVIGDMIRVTRVSGGYLIYGSIAEERGLFMFSDIGRFIGKIGAVGRGPGEYVALTSYVYDEASGIVHIYDQTQRSIFKYKLDGSFVGKLNLDLIIEDFTISRNGNYILYGSFGSTNPNTGEKLPRGVYLANKNGKYLSTIYGIDEDDKYQFFNQLFFTRSEINSNLLSSFDDNIYSFEDDSMIRKYGVDYGKRALSSDNRVNSELPNLLGEFIFAKAMPSENDRYVFFWAFVSGGNKTLVCLLDKKEQTCNLFDVVAGTIKEYRSIIIGGSEKEFYAILKKDPRRSNNIETEVEGQALLQILYTKH